MPDASPYTSLSRLLDPRSNTKRQLLAMSRSIEARALAAGDVAELWISLQHARFFSGRTRRLHEELARAGVRVHVYGEQVRATRPTVPSMTLHDVSGHSVLAHEWDVLLVTPTSALALASSELPPDPAAPVEDDLDRRFEWVLSEDRADVVYAAASLPLDTFVPGRSFGARQPV